METKDIEISEMVREFCADRLNDEYENLCSNLLDCILEEEPATFNRGRSEIWAAAVVHAIGSNNFLFDKSFEPYVSASELNAHFGTKNGSVTSKSRKMQDSFGITYWHPEYSTVKMMETNPMHTMVMLDGFIVSLKSIPEDMQVYVREQRALGNDVTLETVRE